jgi:hypothetical protein
MRDILAGLKRGGADGQALEKLGTEGSAELSHRSLEYSTSPQKVLFRLRGLISDFGMLKSVRLRFRDNAVNLLEVFHS